MNLDKTADVVTLYATRTNGDRNCGNCHHRHGRNQMFWKCLRTGSYTDLEMKYGGKCSHGNELHLWAPRPSLLLRIRNYFMGARK